METMPATGSGEAGTGAAERYGPVQANETLGAIARTLRPAGSVSIDQVMLALVELNPGAFIGGNINGLRRDAYLAVPTLARIQRLDPQRAASEVSRHHRRWFTAASRAVPTTGVAAAVAPAEIGMESVKLRIESTLDEPVRAALSPGANGRPELQAVVARLDEQRQSMNRNEEKLDLLHSQLTVYGTEIQRLRTSLETQQQQIRQVVADSIARAAGTTPTAQPVDPVLWALAGLIGGIGLAGLASFMYALGRRRGAWQSQAAPMAPDAPLDLRLVKP